MSTESIVILGGGITGLATAWFLAERGSELARHATAQNAPILRTAIVGRIAVDGLTGATQPHPLVLQVDPARFVAQPGASAASAASTVSTPS